MTTPDKPAAPVQQGDLIRCLQACVDDPMWADHAEISKATLRAAIAALSHPAPGAGQQEAVAYLDIGAGGYLDIGSDLSDDDLLKLPKGRHMLGIIGTYGVDGYKAAAHPVEAQQAASGGPLTRQQVYDQFAFLEGLVREDTYRRIADKAFELASRAAPAAPAVEAVTDDEQRAFHDWWQEITPRLFAKMTPVNVAEAAWYARAALARKGGV